MGLFHFLFSLHGASRDGSTPDKAIIVGSVSEEYAWMKRYCSGYQPKAQALKEINGKPYDVVTWQNSSGQCRTVYFNISRFYGR